MDKLWKATERKLSKILGGKRVPVHSTDGIKCDITCPAWSVEVKERKRLPVLLKDTVAQARRNCEDGKLAIAVFHEKGKNHDTDIVAVKLSDWIEWYG